MRAPGMLVLLFAALLASCAPRVNVSTGTTIGLKATPGDGQSRPPQVMLGYKRGELALVPTEGKGATKDTDAASTLASIHFSTKWFGHTELDSFIATGMAAHALVAPTSVYTDTLAQVTLGVVSPAIQSRRVTLASRLDRLTDDQTAQVLSRAQYDVKPGKNARESLRDYILSAQTDASLQQLESAFFRQP
jgi:hypothetical protein